MSLGFSQIVEKRTLKETWIIVLAVLAVVVLPARSLAQDMSFDLDEAESAGGEAEAEGSDDGGAMEFSEDETEAEPDDEGDDDSGDVFDELSAGDDDEIEGDEGSIARETEIAEEIYAVQRMYVLRGGRFELIPSYAVTVNDQFVTHPAASIGLNYWITNVLAIGTNFLWYQGIESESDLNFSIRRSFRLAVPITEYQLGGHLNFTYVPIYGKFTMFNDSIFQWDAYLVGGIGMVRTRPVAVVDPAIRKFDFDWRVAFNAGIGLRVFVTRWLTVFGELRDYIYLEKLENLNVELRGGRSDENTWIDADTALTNNVAVHLGATIFFPFTFDYRYPK